MRDFYNAYEGVESSTEKMRLEWQQLLTDHHGLEERLNALPPRIFSGKASVTPGARAVFFCYALPAPEASEDGDATRWTEEAGQSRWFLVDLVTGEIAEEAREIINVIRCAPDTPRSNALPAETLGELRAKVEKHIKNSHFKKVQAPAGVRPVLKAWLELA